MLQGFRRNVFLCSLLLFQALAIGCAGPNRAVLPPADGHSRALPDHLRELRIGDLVQIELHSGGSETGEVVEATHEMVLLGRPGNFGYQEVTILAGDIKTMRLNGGDTAGDAAKGVFATGLATIGLFVGAVLIWGFHSTD